MKTKILLKVTLKHIAAKQFKALTAIKKYRSVIFLLGNKTYRETREADFLFYL